MNMRWSLDELYTSFDSKEYKEDFKDPSFFRPSLELIEADIDKFIQLLD